ncbi:MAG: hypothetical protein A3I24_01745 [Candidatus Harrisonbacteria bacterium RIFCSPLOWO2_02_FULL_41_13b]|uniref:Homing endonuclease LAGLIDADG domain-containing protein n=1 Tax=Candidatus Harrisonbacteria bacterium RIFCSPLOWO2_02_FULL_41_13b TaxID=1798409 RepID=A0A1G1ZUE2_9BACT|nr:MAG: hypothetical protein A3J53_01165 [Candidatus Harrisonbacteria bacterium RIFCSPHIGHO2_02_FULL_40_20]OGY68323.1 MAG: hypothetical protein A3I24_01745 [Candidatus Harrisonbacteria bacterium RIFCSPLOWO2_02_FULL_41_13b]
MENKFQEFSISDDYIRGLIDGEGCFTFCNVPVYRGKEKVKLPAFALKMNERDIDLIKKIKDQLGLRNKIYIYRQTTLKTFNSSGPKIYQRGRTATLIVRDLGQLKNIIVPFFYKKLIGHKGVQFIEWLENIGRDPLVHEDYKLIYRLYKSGFFDRDHVDYRPIR